MNPEQMSLVEWLRQYLSEYFPGQALDVRAEGIDTLIVDVTDPSGKPRELRFSVEDLTERRAASAGPSKLIKFSR